MRRFSRIGGLVLAAAAAYYLLDERARPGAWNTICLAAAASALALPLGVLLAWLLFRTDLPGRRWLLGVVGGLMFFPLYLQAAGWEAGFGLLGWQTTLSGRVGSQLLRGWTAAIWIHATAAVPWVALIVGQGLRHVPGELEDAARLDASHWQVFWRVTLRTAAGSVAVAALWVLLTVAGEMVVSDLYQIRTFAEELYKGYALGMSAGEILILLSPGMAATATLTVGAALLIDRLSSRGPASGGRLQRLGAYWGWAVALVAVVVSWLFLLPVGNLLWQAGVQPRSDRLPWSLLSCCRVVARSAYSFRHEIGWTLLLSTLVATLSVAVALPLAMMGRRGGWRSAPAVVTAAVCLAVPGPLWGWAVAGVLNRPLFGNLYFRTVTAPVLAMTLRCLPLALLILWHAARTLPGELLESAAVDGASWWRRWSLIAWPLRQASAGVAWLAACAVAQADVAASILVMPGDVETASIRLFGLAHSGVREQLAGLALVMTAAFMLLALLLVHLARRSLAPPADGLQ